MSSNYNGLTRNTWPGTWSPDGDHPIALSNELRGGLQYVAGVTGDTLQDIPRQRLQPGMICFVDQTYGSITGQKYYTYKLLDGESRNDATGEMPNNANNWVEFNPGADATESASLESSSNVNSAAPQAGALLQYNGTEWEANNNIETTVGSLRLNGGSF
jgi:hypothetical protein